LPLDQAKILFGDSIDVYSETVVTVKPKFGFFVEHYLFTDFDILYVTKNYYKANTWDDQSKSYSGEPILSIRIFSNKIHPLHP